MEKIKKWIKKNKGLAIMVGLALVLIIFMVIILMQLLIGGSSNKYGHRLDEIKDAKINPDTYDGVEIELTDTGVVEKAEVRLQGKIVYTTIVLKSDTSVDKAKEVATATLDNYTEKQLEYYDFSFFLKWEKEEKNVVITGNKHQDLDSISWVKS